MAFWIMLIWVVAINLLFRQSMTDTVLCDDGGYEYRAHTGFAFLLFLVPLLIISTRTDFIDTASYISMFNGLPDELEEFENTVSSRSTAQLFYGISTLFKIFISDNSSAWLAFIACLQAFLISKTLKKYSADFGFSMFLLVSTSIVGSWMCNGIRQFIAVAILFACTDWLINGKWYLCFAMAIILMGISPIASYIYIDEIPWFLDGIHESALIAVGALFFVNGKAFNKRLWILAAILVVLIFTGGLDSMLSSSVENTSYVGDMEYVDADTGTNIFRVLVQAAPLALAFFARKEILNSDTPKVIHLAVNCSFVSTILYVASAFTSGIYVGRLPIYFEIYNLILIPWLLAHPYKENRKLFTGAIMLAYTAYFFYQVNITWDDNLLISTLPGLGG